MTTADVGVVGLGVMGASLARNFRSRGLGVAVYNRSTQVTDAFMAAHGDAGFTAASDYAGLTAALSRPRRIVLLVKAGRPVDLVLEALEPHLDPGDIVIDGGNSHWPDTDRRLAWAAERAFRFVGMGVSGGERGALEGPSMMPGGDETTWEDLRSILEPAAAVSDSGPCVAFCGRGSAGHFVKMVHNGIEYGDMQLIAETYTLMRHLGMDSAEIGQVFGGWNDGRLRSFLVEITAGICGVRDPEGSGFLVDAILDVAGQKGTGRWTSIGAIELGVPLPTVTAAVDGRALSAMKSVRTEAAARFADRQTSALEGLTVPDLEAALYGAKIMSYTQGFAMLREASDERDYGTDMAEMARIWKAGCIIRAAFLDDVYDAFRARPDLPLLMMDETFATRLEELLGPWRRVVAAAALAGIPAPALSASLAYFDTLTTAEGSASLIQAQRDWFGAHTYRRKAAPEVAVHSEWEQLAGEI